MKAADLKNLDLRDLVDELNNLDFENLGGWPLPAKILSAVLVLLLVLGLGYFMVIKDAKSSLDRHQREEQTLVRDFETKAFRAANLDQYRQQMMDMEETFGTLLQQLPQDTEVPGLLEDITHTGLSSGLEFDMIELRPEVTREFYIELPIAIKVVGDYHAFGAFVSGVAGLPRIVTLHDFEIGRSQNEQRRALGLLNLDITAKTYRYASTDEPPPVSGRR